MKRLFVLIVALVLIASMASCGSAPADNSLNSQPAQSAAVSSVPAVTPVLDISTIANKTPEEVSSVLGDPTMSETGAVVSNTYSDGTEVYFVDGIAARITVYPPAGSKVEDGAALIGLTPEQAGTPSYDMLEDYRWNDNTEYFSVDAFNNGDGTISYIYVITNEKYQ